MTANYKVSEELNEWIIKQRRYLHEHPELSHEEENTRAYIRQRLEEMGYSTSSHTGKDVVADLQGDKPGPVIALRADIDALEVEEQTGLPYASKRKGFMHACGHDGHTAMLLGAAKLLKDYRKDINGTVRFIFQHAEETVPGGAEELVKAGVLKGVSAIIGCHLWEPLVKGKAGFLPGPLMAGADRIRVKIQGKGGHGSMPHLAVDSVLVSTHAIQQLYSIVSREIDPLKPAVLSIGELKMGTTYNVIPDHAYFSGTIRYHDLSVQSLFRRRIEEILRGVSTSFNADYELEYEVGEPPLINDSELTAFVKTQAHEVMKAENIAVAEQSLGGEDFAYYSLEIPACYFFLGIGEPGRTFGHHHPKFDIDESMMAKGTELLARSAVQYLIKQAGVS